jgi:hypothetical protein
VATRFTIATMALPPLQTLKVLADKSIVPDSCAAARLAAWVSYSTDRYAFERGGIRHCVAGSAVGRFFTELVAIIVVTKAAGTGLLRPGAAAFARRSRP